MKTLIKPLLLVMTSIGISSCSVSVPIAKVAPENNRTYQVEYLFEHDGCKVYRFFDQGSYVYFTNCTGEITSMKSDTTETRVQNVVKSNVVN